MNRLALFLLSAPLLLADAGVLMPTTPPEAGKVIFTLAEMKVSVFIDNGHARIRTQQIYRNETGVPQEGSYSFALPSRASVSDFAVWDGLTRIPGVILERRRAEEIYNEAKNQTIDPGLLQQGESADEGRRNNLFTAKIVPVPAYGTKRIELEYYDRLPVENRELYFALPLRPDAYQAQTAGRLSLSLEIHSAHAMKGVHAAGSHYPLKISSRDDHAFRAVFEGVNLPLTEDFAVQYSIEAAPGQQLQIVAHRDPAVETAGFFLAAALLPSPVTQQAESPSRTVIALFDTSLSMQWEKLERSYEALEALLHVLRPKDRFHLLAFNSEVKAFAPEASAAGPDKTEAALQYIRNQRLQGGTNLQAALAAAMARSTEPETYIVLLSDGGASEGLVQNGKLAAWYERQWKAMPVARRPHTYAYAVGDDANLSLLRMLARQDGVLEEVRSTEPSEFKLKAFLGKLGEHSVEDLRFSTTAKTDFVYPLEAARFGGSVASWIGQYQAPQSASFRMDGNGVAYRTTAALPSQNLEHPELPRTWARARVDALLEKIEREGEDRASIDEIIRLSRRYKFVTPYTSFLAAPRALLRPRVIRPGDPLLRVRTDSSITSVVALFPFGLVKPLRYLQTENIWQTRFLGPPDMEDGSYPVRLVLRDRQGRVYRESKTITIVSKPPIVRLLLDRRQFRRGETVRLRVKASALTRTVTARLTGAISVPLRWDSKAGANTGDLIIPEQLPPGRYSLHITAEDIARNVGSEETSLEIR